MQKLDISAMWEAAQKMTGRGVRYCECGAEIRLSMRRCGACEARKRYEGARRGKERAIAETERTIPAHFAWARFDSPLLVERVQPRAAVDLAKSAKAARLVVLQGESGTGKTSLAVAMLRAIADRGERGMFVDARALTRARQGHGFGGGEAPLIERAMRARVLVLDEVGAERGVGMAESVVAEVIHERHAHARQTIYCTPFTSTELVERYGAGIVRRMLEDVTAIRLARPVGKS